MYKGPPQPERNPATFTPAQLAEYRRVHLGLLSVIKDREEAERLAPPPPPVAHNGGALRATITRYRNLLSVAKDTATRKRLEARIAAVEQRLNPVR